MAKGSSTKSGSPKKSSKKDSPSKDDRKGKKGSDKRTLPKWSVEECLKADEETFARRRYEDPMDTAYKRVTDHIALIVKNIHIYEAFNEAPEVPQFCNSNKSSKGSPKSKGISHKEKGSSKDKAKSPSVDEPLPPLYETPILQGVVALRRQFILEEDEKLFIEVTATWKYKEESKITPFPPQVHCEHQCYRDYYFIKPANFERIVLPTHFNQTLIRKIRHEYGAQWEGYPFFFNLKGAPSSLTFNRPYHYDDAKNGIFWKLRAYLGKFEFSKPTPDKEVSLNFWKFTIAPSLLTYTLRKSAPFNYIRHKTLDDIGDLYLSASLNRDLYYHNEEITVTINVENNSQRHVINSITVFIEQNYRFFQQIPHDHSIPLNEVWLKPGENGLPINPKSKSWCKVVQIKPLYDWSKYNLVCDGKMERDDKVFLASTTIIMKNIPLTPEEIEALAEADNKSSKAKGSPDKGSKGSPQKDSPNKESVKGSSQKKESIKKGKSSPKEETPPDETSEGEAPPAEILTKQILTNRDLFHPVFISYDIVVRLNLQTPSYKEAGHPAVRVPFILSRETRLIDKWTTPPTWSHLPLKCDGAHTMKSQPHIYCKKLDIPVEEVSKSPASKKDFPKKDSKASPKSKGSPKSKK